MTTSHDNDEAVRLAAEAVTTQARWLYEVHTKRAESAQQRAVAVSAVAGVLLTLAPKGAAQHPNYGLLGLLVASQLSSILAILFAAGVLVPVRTKVPQARALRETWSRYRQDMEGSMAAQMAEDLLRSSEMDELSAVDYAKEEADTRVKRLKRAYWVLGAALLLASALVLVNAI